MQRQTHRQQGELTSLHLFLQNTGSKHKIVCNGEQEVRLLSYDTTRTRQKTKKLRRRYTDTQTARLFHNPPKMGGGGGYTDTERQRGDLISLHLFFNILKVE
jgi:hypothetical protein